MTIPQISPLSLTSVLTINRIWFPKNSYPATSVNTNQPANNSSAHHLNLERLTELIQKAENWGGEVGFLLDLYG